MPDSRSHRGAHPADRTDFAPAALPALRTAAHELSYLLDRDYAVDASVKLVGDHHQLTVRQRKAVLRASCAPSRLPARTGRRLDVGDLRGRAVALDGFNCLITVEAMLSGAPLFRGLDGVLRDLASVHGTYRSVEESEPAARLLIEQLASAGPSSVRILLDRPVGNSGRTRALYAEVCAAARLEAEVALSDRVDKDLLESSAVVASSDSWLLDHAAAWVDLPSAVLAARAETAWLVELAGG